VNAGFSLHPVCPKTSLNVVFVFLMPFAVLFFLFMYSFPPVDSMALKTTLRFMSLETDGAHPLATEPDIQLDTELSVVSVLDVRADVIGDDIVVVLIDLRIHNPESDAIYLVDWKRGRMTLVSCASCIQYGMGAKAPVLISTHLSFHPPSGTPRPKWNV
jgi:hypothetical protein